MIEKVCSKLRRGSLGYQVDFENQTIRLLSDFPVTGEVGGKFDSTPVDFKSINDVLNKRAVHQSRDFTHCFVKHSGNNSPMLTAVLVDLGVLKRNKNEFTVVKTL